jgi:hypothetical protein
MSFIESFLLNLIPSSGVTVPLNETFNVSVGGVPITVAVTASLVVKKA